MTFVQVLIFNVVMLALGGGLVYWLTTHHRNHHKPKSTPQH